MIYQLRSDLLELHKQLVDISKYEYQKIHGPIAGPAALFKLLVEHSLFQWLRSLSETIVAIDEALETNPPATQEAIIKMIHRRLFPEKPNEFSQKLIDYMNEKQEIRNAVQAIKAHFN